MKLFLTFLIFVSCLFLVAAEGEELFSAAKITVQLDLSSAMQLVPKGNQYAIDYLLVNLTHIPAQTETQKIISLSSIPQARQTEQGLEYAWDDPDPTLSFGYHSTIETRFNSPQINSKIPFPLNSIPEELNEYLLPQEHIDSDNEDIIRMASTLAEGEDDMYVVVSKMAAWTKQNVEYNLSTLTAEVSQPASWVLYNKKGVCDELTSLFIAMLRSIGIPARFISGVAYTNSPLFEENWGSHGWAEVYFPGIGWVPYDVTYGEFGFVDATHIVLKESYDSGASSVQYHWVGRNVDLRTEPLEITTSVLSAQGKRPEPYLITIETLRDVVGFGSYNLIEAHVSNTENSYKSTSMALILPEEILIASQNKEQQIILGPGEKKSIYWIVQVPSSLDKKFKYTFPFTITYDQANKESALFEAEARGFIYSYSELDTLLSQQKEEQDKLYSRALSMDCIPDKNQIFTYETIKIRCVINNEGNTFIKNARFCFDKNCSTIEVGISQKKEFNFTFSRDTEDSYRIPVTLKNTFISKASYVDMSVLSLPKLQSKISRLPETVGFVDVVDATLTLKKTSLAIPKNIRVVIDYGIVKEAWSIDALYDEQPLALQIKGKDLSKGKNEIREVITYHDDNGKAYESTTSFFISLENVTFTQTVLLSMHHFVQKFGAVAVPSFYLITVAFLFIFITIVMYVFRKKENAMKNKKQL